MANNVFNRMYFFWWLRHILFFWVRTKVVPSTPKVELNLTPGIPVCYVLNTQSVTDILVLEQICQEHGLPLPRYHSSQLREPGRAGFLCLHKMGLFQIDRSLTKEPSIELKTLVQSVVKNPDQDVQIVPVSVLWGRNPGREEKSIFKLLFFDDEYAGVLQKLFIVLAQGRVNYLQFGKSISLREFVDSAQEKGELAKKLRRVLRVHFKLQRQQAMGPSLTRRSQVAANIVAAKAVREAIEDEARKKKIPIERAEAMARRYIWEIACDQNYSMIRLADIVLAKLWNKLYRGLVVKHGERLREIEKTHEIVYLPAHRSHLDYLLLAYCLYQEGQPPPHTAAGINLNFWPAGPILRRCGAFYIRRTFAGNRLYTVVFNEYVHYLLTKGHPVKFYIEGGRSRTGKLLPAKTGMLAMVVHSYLRNSSRPIAFVPTYVGYDRVFEVDTYQGELRGKAKAKESAGLLFSARSIFKMNFGRAYIGFSQPIYLKDSLTAFKSDWADDEVSHETKPKWLNPFVSKLAGEVLTSINANAVVSAQGIFALVILSSPTKAVTEDDLLYLIEKLISAMRATPYSRDVELPLGDAKDILNEALATAKAERFSHPGGDVIYMHEYEASNLAYYRNNLLHLVAIPSLIASYFLHHESAREEDLVRSGVKFYPFLKSEYFLRWESDDAEKVVKRVVEGLISQGLLERAQDGFIQRPKVTDRELTTLFYLGRTLGQLLERYAIATQILANHKQGIERQTFETQCSLMAQRIAILYGVNSPELQDSKLYKGFVDELRSLGYAEIAENNVLKPTDKIIGLARDSARLLSGDIRSSITRMYDLTT